MVRPNFFPISNFRMKKSVLTQQSVRFDNSGLVVVDIIGQHFQLLLLNPIYRFVVFGLDGVGVYHLLAEPLGCRVGFLVVLEEN